MRCYLVNPNIIKYTKHSGGKERTLMVENLLEQIIAGLLVGIVLIAAGQPLYRALTGKAARCRCCGPHGCGTHQGGRQPPCSADVLPVMREDKR